MPEPSPPTRGLVHLARFDADLHVVASTSLGECNDGAELATDPQSSAVLVNDITW
ncbi:MAG: hypothetical protein ACLQGJ_09970 [Candidatus Dormibacteria bacterium]